LVECLRKIFGTANIPPLVNRDVYEKILIAVDGSEPSFKAIDYGVNLAKRFDSSITLLTVIDEFKLPFAAEYGLWGDESRNELMRKVLESLNEVVNRISWKEEVKIDAMMKEGRPAEVIVETAWENGFVLIIMGHRGYGLMKDLVLGSVSQEVVNNSRIPVLVVK